MNLAYKVKENCKSPLPFPVQLWQRFPCQRTEWVVVGGKGSSVPVCLFGKIFWPSSAGLPVKLCPVLCTSRFWHGSLGGVAQAEGRSGAGWQRGAVGGWEVPTLLTAQRGSNIAPCSYPTYFKMDICILCVYPFLRHMLRSFVFPPFFAPFGFCCKIALNLCWYSFPFIYTENNILSMSADFFF